MDHGWQLQALPWVPGGYVIDRADRSVPLGHSLEHFAGHFYIQEASSMIPPVVLDPQPGERVLDLAAAPGSKTTQIAGMMHNTGLVVANDSSVPRLKALTANLERIGTINTVITQLAGQRLGRFAAGQFDRVLIDAPCTAEGTIAKSPEALHRWSENAIRKLSTIQSKLLAGAYQALKPGGTLVYSTCTFAPEENEAVVDGFLRVHPEADVLAFDLPGLSLAPGLTAWEGVSFDARLAHTRRVWPGAEPMEGFFIAKLHKPEGAPVEEGGRPFADRRYGDTTEDAAEWLGDRFGFTSGDEVWRTKDSDRWVMTAEASAFDRLPIIRRGLRAARTVRGGFKPTTDYLQLIGATIESNRLTLDAKATRQYLRGEDVEVHTGRGYIALEHDGIVFACGLGQEDRIKNQLPVSRRIGVR